MVTVLSIWRVVKFKSMKMVRRMAMELQRRMMVIGEDNKVIGGKFYEWTSITIGASRSLIMIMCRLQFFRLVYKVSMSGRKRFL